MKKKFFALLMAFCMVFGMTSMALAADTTLTTEQMANGVETVLVAGDTDGYTYSYTVADDFEGTALIKLNITDKSTYYNVQLRNTTTNDYDNATYDSYGNNEDTVQIKASANDEITITITSSSFGQDETTGEWGWIYSALALDWNATVVAVGTSSSPEEIAEMYNSVNGGVQLATTVSSGDTGYYYNYTPSVKGTFSVYVDVYNSIDSYAGTEYDDPAVPNTEAELAADIVVKNKTTGKTVKFSETETEIPVGYFGDMYAVAQVEASANDVIEVQILSSSSTYETVDVVWVAMFDEPLGSAGNPISVSTNNVKATIPAGETYYFGVARQLLQYPLCVSGANAVIYDTRGQECTVEDEVVTGYFNMDWNTGMAPFSIKNTGDEAVEYTVYFDMPLGIESNPEVLEGEEDSATQSLEAETGYYGYYYSWKAPADGILTLSLDSEAGWKATVMSDSIYDYFFDIEERDGVYAVKKDEVVSIQVFAVDTELIVPTDEEKEQGATEYIDYTYVDGTVATSVEFVESVGSVMDVEDFSEISDKLWNSEYDEDGYITLNVDGDSVVENPITVISPDLLNAVKAYNESTDSEIAIMLVTDSYMWYIDVTDMDANLIPVDLGITFADDNGNIPEATIEDIADGNEWGVFSIAHDGDFGFDAVLVFALNSEEAIEKYLGKEVALYWYNDEGELELVGEKCTIEEDGLFMFVMTHASDYVMVIEGTATTENPGGNTDTTPGGNTDTTPTPQPTPDPVDPPETGDTTNAILWFAVLGLGLVAIAGSVVMKKREF